MLTRTRGFSTCVSLAMPVLAVTTLFVVPANAVIVQRYMNLLIEQFLPSPGMGSVASTITGNVTLDTNTGKLQFIPTNTVTIGAVTCQFDDVRVVPTSTNSGTAPIQGSVTAVPEPGFYLLSRSASLEYSHLSAPVQRKKCSNG